MVNLEKLNYNLNHIFNDTIPTGQVAIGQTADDEDTEFEIFQKSLALTSDLKRLPVMRGVHIVPLIHEDIISLMVASGVGGLRAIFTLYNCEANSIDPKHRIGSATVHITYDAVNGFAIIQSEQFQMSYQGGILLNPSISARGSIDTDVAVAGAAFAGNILQALFDLELDWVPITKKQFEDYILESVYAKDQE